MKNCIIQIVERFHILLPFLEGTTEINYKVLETVHLTSLAPASRNCVLIPSKVSSSLQMFSPRDGYFRRTPCTVGDEEDRLDLFSSVLRGNICSIIPIICLTITKSSIDGFWKYLSDGFHA